MLYLVCHDAIDTVNEFICDDNNYFIVEADNDKELATAIANVVIDCDWYSGEAEVDTTCWNVRELGDNFEFQIFSPKTFEGKRL